MFREIEYRKIERLLQRFGFEMKKSKGSHITFTHPGIKSVIVLSARHGSVSKHQVVYVLRTLVENKLISEGEFEDFLKKS